MGISKEYYRSGLMDDKVLAIADFVDKLKIEGINYKGFGILPKYVMIDPDLSIEAKAIYAYFCSYAGNGDTAFPGRDTITHHLQVNKDTYYKHLRTLINQGYLSVNQEHHKGGKGNGFSRNIYTIISNPKKFIERSKDPKHALIYSRIKFSGIKAVGFGIIPKAVMMDTRLKIKAKAIYAYFCSFTGSGDSAFPKLQNILYHLHISQKTYHKYYKVLLAFNYISVVQRHTDGRLSVNDYYLTDNPDVTNAESKTVSVQVGNFSDTQNVVNSPSITAYQVGNFSDTQKQDTQKQDTQNSDTNINSSNINNSNNTQSINQQKEIDGLSKTEKESIILKELFKEKVFPKWYASDYDRTTIAIHIMTEWEKFYPDGYKDELRQSIYNLFNEALIEMCCSQKVMTLKGCPVTNVNVIEKINLMARFEDGYIDISTFMETALDDYFSSTKEREIINPMAYMKSCIWNAMQIGLVSEYSDLNLNGYM